MFIDHDAKTKFFLVMPFMDGMTDSEGSMKAVFPHPDYCDIRFDREEAEKVLLQKQKSDPEVSYILVESISACAKHMGRNEYCVSDTINC